MAPGIFHRGAGLQNRSMSARLRRYFQELSKTRNAKAKKYCPLKVSGTVLNDAETAICYSMDDHENVSSA